MLRTLGWILLLLLVSFALWWWQYASRDRDGGFVSLSCPGSLTEFVDCVQDNMPRGRHGDSAFEALFRRYTLPTPPTEQQRLALSMAAQSVYRTALSDAPNCATALPPAIAHRYVVSPVLADQAHYCVLWEGWRDSVALGWGTLIVNRAPQRQLVLAVPHPLYDLDTLAQARELLVETGALALVVAGAHRYASGVSGECDAWPFAAADASHQQTGYNVLAGAVAAMPEFSELPWWVVEWHGMAPSSDANICMDPDAGRPFDVYLSAGVEPIASADTFAARLADELREAQPDWLVGSTSEPAPCDKAGTANLLGRYLNGAPTASVGSACGIPFERAVAASGRFVHIEQLQCAGGASCRDDQDVVRRAAAWVPALTRTYAELAGEGAEP